MKKLIIIIPLLVCLFAKAQDSTKLANIKLTAAVQWYATPFLIDSRNQDAFRLLIKWAGLQSPSTTLGDTILTDTIPVAVMVALYRTANEISSGSGAIFLTHLTNQLVAYRTNATPARASLKRQCDLIDAEMISRRNDLLFDGRRKLRGN